jgi:BirA family biotin operon repressor/biotin-[acetyl-CoA-carboxylase] ligase
VNPIIWRVEHFVEIDSTNTWAVAQALQGAPEGLVAYADFQSKGRGRLERQWEAAPDTSLLCSVLLRPGIDVVDLQLTVACVALAARAALVRLCGVRPDLKWPNDLIVGEAKIAGLLAELVAGEGGAVVVGIGVNLLPTGPVDGRSTSVWQEAGVRITPQALLDILLEEIEPRRLLLSDALGRRQLRDEYTKALVTAGQCVRVLQHQGESRGLATGVDRSGRLIVEINGIETVFDSGDVVHLRLDEEDKA